MCSTWFGGEREGCGPWRQTHKASSMLGEPRVVPFTRTESKARATWVPYLHYFPMEYNYIYNSAQTAPIQRCTKHRPYHAPTAPFLPHHIHSAHAKHIRYVTRIHLDLRQTWMSTQEMFKSFWFELFICVWYLLHEVRDVARILLRPWRAKRLARGQFLAPETANVHRWGQATCSFRKHPLHRSRLPTSIASPPNSRGKKNNFWRKKEFYRLGTRAADHAI